MQVSSSSVCAPSLGPETGCSSRCVLVCSVTVCRSVCVCLDLVSCLRQIAHPGVTVHRSVTQMCVRFWHEMEPCLSLMLETHTRIHLKCAFDLQ